MYLDGRGIRGRGPRGERVVDDSFLLVLHTGAADVRFRLPGAPYARSYDVVLDTCAERPCRAPGRGCWRGPSLPSPAGRRCSCARRGSDRRAQTAVDGSSQAVRAAGWMDTCAAGWPSMGTGAELRLTVPVRPCLRNASRRDRSTAAPLTLGTACSHMLLIWTLVTLASSCGLLAAARLDERQVRCDRGVLSRPTPTPVPEQTATPDLVACLTPGTAAGPQRRRLTSAPPEPAAVGRPEARLRRRQQGQVGVAGQGLGVGQDPHAVAEGPGPLERDDALVAVDAVVAGAGVGERAGRPASASSSDSSTRPYAACTVTSDGRQPAEVDERADLERRADRRGVAAAGGLDVDDPHAGPVRHDLAAPLRQLAGRRRTTTSASSRDATAAGA